MRVSWIPNAGDQTTYRVDKSHLQLQETRMAEIEYGGIKVGGSKLLLILPLIGTLGGGLWAGFEFYKDYMNMKEIIQNIDTDAIAARNDVLETKLDEALEYSRDIKNGLREDIVRIERIVDSVEDDINEIEDDVRTTIDDAEERFEVKRQDLLNQYVAQKDLLIRENTATRDILETKIQNLEADMEKQLQRALDNPLANRN